MLISRRALPTLLALTTTLAFSSAALAHAHLKHQFPAADAAVSESPKALTLSFSEGVEQNFSKVMLTGPNNQLVATGNRPEAAATTSSWRCRSRPPSKPVTIRCSGRWFPWTAIKPKGHGPLA